MTFFVRTPSLIRLIPIWDGSQLTFKKSNNTEKQGEIINNSSENVAKTNENRIENGKNLLYEKIVDGCVKGDCKNGYGAMTYPSGEKYVGNFKDGKQNGYGTYTFSNGIKYVGNFKDDYFNGYGTKTWPNGDKYVGEFKYNFINGYGTYTHSNGDKYVGNSKDNKKNGYGTFTYSDGAKYVGNFKNGERNGYGTYINSYGNKYVGNFKDDEYNGYGTLTFPDGDKYVGNFKNFGRDGYGAYTFSNGSKYAGNVKENNFDGYGTYTNIHGIEFSGNWVNNKLNGKSLDDLDKLTKPIEKNKNPNPSKPDKPETTNGKIIELDDKLFLPTKFELVADDIYYNLIREKIPNVTIVSEPDISEQNGYLTICEFDIKIGAKEYSAIFNEDGLSLDEKVSDKNVKAVWDNKNLTVRPFTSQEIKDAKQDSRLYSDIQLLGGDKFKMEETKLRFKQLIK
jgi:hypothetical protein